jgi:hypothetical protein
MSLHDEEPDAAERCSRGPVRVTSQGATVSKFRDQFSKKDWKKCCGKGCKKCDLYNAYLDEFGGKAGKKRFKKDHDKLH